ncbi:MAG: CCA tRNA nucleotidyltransferase [FCB group bacterium]|nr:CCA tRNA nucleotidyltransferase [FCB group bacterium]
MDIRLKTAREICARLERRGFRALLAGGCVRDLILDVEPKDYDIATNATPEQVAELFDKTVPVGAAFGVQIVVLPEGHFEVTTFRKDGPYLDGRHPSSIQYTGEEEDARRRDFTINAMFFDPKTESIVDYVGGRADLTAQVIRTVGNPRERFAEDHLRLMRAIRFAARLGYAIEPETFAAVREMAPLITTTSGERIRDEIVRMLTEGGARRGFELMDDTGLLGHVLPELLPMKGCEQPPEFHPEGDVWTHTLMALDLLDKPTLPLALGVLLHDVGKPVTQTFEDRIRFSNHDKIGAAMADDICRRLHLSNQDRERVVWLVDQHMRLATAPEMRQSKLKRFVREEGFPELLALGRIDCMSSHGDLETNEWIAGYLRNLKPEEIKPEPLVRGRDLIEMGYKPGPVFSQILQQVEDAQLEGEIASAEEARDFVRRNWDVESLNGEF